MARRISFIDRIELPIELDTIGNNGNEISLSLPCHGKQRNLMPRGDQLIANIVRRTDCVCVTLVFPYVTLFATEAHSM